jgi:hypothetical protein
MFIPKSLLFWNSLEVRKKYRTKKKKITLKVSIIYIYHCFPFFVAGDDKVEPNITEINDFTDTINFWGKI